ncbi:hypothetical protein [Stieleria marina]|uniref:Uncharacterized protein n=1 Tax=Stieleria marina TaxID=1930275 RepID=A0A517NTX5_9BACT|nr:hypothetical protein K239x_25350 [Planctomycetes bacterium K23_9]
MIRTALCLLALAISFSTRTLSAQEDKRSAGDSETRQPGEQAGEQAVSGVAADAEAKETKLANYLSGAKFVGKFTIDGREDKTPKTETYTISKCQKLPEADMYRLTARIKYGDVDQEVPLDLKILWSGRTPVITMDQFWIPGMGTFGARVLIHSNRYAGTWQHDAVGGHMFGKIVTGESK